MTVSMNGGCQTFSQGPREVDHFTTPILGAISLPPRTHPACDSYYYSRFAEERSWPQRGEMPYPR